MKKLLLFLALVLAPVSAWGQTTTTIYRVDTIAALKAIPTSRPPIVIVMDVATGGQFEWGTTPCSAADDVFQVTPTSGPTGCWTRMSNANAVGKSATANGVLVTSAGGVPSISTTLPAVTLSGALTYGGVTLSNSVTGTGSMVLGTNPTITQTATGTGGASTSVLNYMEKSCLNAAALYGANGTAGDGARIQAALTAASVAGKVNCVYLPPIGGPYIIDAGISIPNGVALYGNATENLPSITGTVAQYTAKGSWLKCTDAVNPCVTILSHGSTIDGINFIWDQVVPTVGVYAPTSFPDGIYVPGTLFQIRNVMMMGGTRCINVDYLTGSGGGTYSQMENLKLGCLSTGIRFANVNDVMYLRDIDVRILWHSTNTSLVEYTLNNLIGMDVNYLDNPVINGYQAFYANRAFKFTNGTALGITHSLYNGLLTNIQCSLVRYCMDVAAATTVVSFNATNVIAQGATTTYLAAETMFALGTDFLQANFNDLNVISTGGKVMVAGNGTAGNVKIGTLALGTNVTGTPIGGYATITAGAVGFDIAAGALLQIGQQKVYYQGGAGALVSGAGTAQTGTLAVTREKTFSVSNTLTLAGTDGTTMTFPATSGTVATLNTANVFTEAPSFSKAQNTYSTFAVTNGNTTAAANAALQLITGTANSNLLLRLGDNSGAPLAEMTLGSAVQTFGLFLTMDKVTFRTSAAAAIASFGTASVTISKPLIYGGVTLSNSVTGTGSMVLSANPTFTGTITTGGYTVAGLPAAPGTGARAYVTNQLTTCAVTGAALTGGGAVTCPVFYNGTAWVGG